MVFKLPASLSAAQLLSISYLNGLDQDGNLNLTNFWNWSGDNPATYGTISALQGLAHKWAADASHTSTVGTGGTAAYFFDTGSNWSGAEQSAFLGAMALWAGVANVTFTPAASESSATLLFFRYGSLTVPSGIPPLSPGYYENDGYYAGSVGTSTIGSTAISYISLQTQAIGSYGDITSFSTYGGYGIDALVHEMGHAIGLGHDGPYNGSVNPSSQQLSATDNRLYSLMSYINPWDTTAHYFNSYSPSGTDWGATSDSYYRAPYTPMVDDILAAQQLYGTSSGTSLNTAQTFGFNTTLAANDPLRPYFDFTVDAKPVITLYDSAPGNTLDLSGYTVTQTINLNPGTFSSVAGLTNNLGIDFNTAIDTVIGGTGNDTIWVNADSDHIDGGTGTNIVMFPSSMATYSFSSSGSTLQVLNISTSTVDYLTHITTVNFAGQTVPASSLFCFLAGTRIATPAGEVPVEALRAGDLVRLADGRALPVRWLGRQTIALRFADKARALPVRICAGALGEGLPRRDLLVSPGHALALDGVLAQAGALVNGASIIREAAMPEVFTYWHVELDEHALLLAEGLAAESYVPTAEEMAFDNRHARPALPPQNEMDLPRAKSARQLPQALRQRLAGAARAA